MRIRTIKPEFWTSETVGRLSYPARLTFIGLWNYADDEGRGIDNPRLIKAALWPLADDISAAEVDRFLGELASHGLISRYGADQRDYFDIPNWSEHQKIDRPRPSAIPPRPVDEQSTKRRRVIAAGSGSGSGSGRERSLVQAEPERFAEWWAIFPRKQAKKAARTAYARALKATTADTLIVAAERYRDDPNREPEYTALPTTWLNQGRWEDEPLPKRGGQTDVERWLASKEAQRG